VRPGTKKIFGGNLRQKWDRRPQQLTHNDEARTAARSGCRKTEIQIRKNQHRTISFAETEQNGTNERRPPRAVHRTMRSSTRGNKKGETKNLTTP
jgi:hypothetical protein